MSKDLTLDQATKEYIEHLRQAGKKERTLYTYGKDFEQIAAFFGADKKLSAIRSMDVGRFLKSDDLLKLPSGKERAKPTVDKTVRVLRMFLVWAASQGYMEKAPLPKDLPMGHTKTDAPGVAAEA